LRYHYYTTYNPAIAEKKILWKEIEKQLLGCVFES